MRIMTFSKLCLLTTVLSLSACSSVGDWFGSSDSEILEGKRVAVLKAESAVSVDPETQTLPVVVPTAQRNVGWYQSKGFHPLVPENSTLAASIKNVKQVRIGESELDTVLRMTPVVAEGMIFTMDAYGLISAHRIDDLSEQVWSYEIGGDKEDDLFANAGFSYQSGTLYVTTGQSEVLALAASDGHVKWRRKITAISRSAPAASDTIVFVNTLDDRLYALDPKDGTILWTHEAMASEVGVLGSASPVTAGDVVIVPYSSGEIYALNSFNGNVLWSDNLARNKKNAFSLADIDATPLLYKNMVIAISQGGVMAAFDVRSGMRLWEQTISGQDTPWIAGEFVYVLSDKNELICLYLPTGAVRWVKQLPRYENEVKKSKPYHWSGPVMAGGRLWLSGAHAVLLEVSPTDGEIVTTHETVDTVYLPPVAAYDSLFLLSNRAVLHVLK